MFTVLVMLLSTAKISQNQKNRNRDPTTPREAPTRIPLETTQNVSNVKENLKMLQLSCRQNRHVTDLDQLEIKCDIFRVLEPGVVVF